MEIFTVYAARNLGKMVVCDTGNCQTQRGFLGIKDREEHLQKEQYGCDTFHFHYF